jgi:hypothetical protein
VKFLPLIWKNIWRKRFRTTLTLLSLFIAFLLFGLLMTIRMAFTFGVDVAGADRLVLIHKVSLIMPLPIAYQSQLQAVPGVEIATHSSWRRKGSAVWLQMNANSYPVPIGDPDPVITDREIADRPHAVHRMRYNSATDQYEADTYLDRTLLRAGLHDPARYAFHVLGQREALRPTAGGRNGGQGGVRRIDRFYLDAWSVQAVTRVEVVDLSQFSDHHVIRVILSVPLLRAALRRDFPPLPPYPASLDYTGIRSITSFVKSR